MSSQIIVYSFLLKEAENGRSGLKGKIVFRIKTAGRYLYIDRNEKREGNDDNKRG